MNVPLGPAALVDRLGELPVAIEGYEVELGSVPVAGYYDGRPRPTGTISLAGGGHVGLGENVDWYAEDQRRFEKSCEELLPRVAPIGETTVGEVSRALLASGTHPHHRAAIEAAAIDLATRQAGTDLFRLAGRPHRPVRFCWSIGRETVEQGGPVAAVEALLAIQPEARVKIDGPSAGWSDATWGALATGATGGRIVVVDFKREGSIAQVALAHRHLPDAWLEDPPAAAWMASDTNDLAPSWLSRVALDGYVLAVTDLDHPPIPPAAVNVKGPRVGGLLEALRCLQSCAQRGWYAYVGGMFEVGVGRQQARDLASLFTPEAWNDLAPLTFS